MTINDNQQHRHVKELATLLVLNDEIRKVTKEPQFETFITKESRRLITYDDSILWIKDRPLSDSQLNVRVKSVIQQVTAHSIDQSKSIHQISINKDHVLWCPFLDKHANISACLLFFRKTPFTDSEIKIIHWLIPSYQYTWSLLHIKHTHEPTRSIKLPSKLVKGLLICLVIVSLLPVHMPQSELSLSKILILKNQLTLDQEALRIAINQGMDDDAINATIPSLKAKVVFDKSQIDSVKVTKIVPLIYYLVN